MKYTLQSSKYVFKNFIYLFPFAILPAVFFAVSTDKTVITDIVNALLVGNISSWTFGKLFNSISILNFASWKTILFGLTGVVLIIFCVALLMALLEKHMRIGKRTYNGLLGKLNDNFMSTLCVVFTVLAIYELWVLLLSAFLFLLSRITIIPMAYALVILAFIAFHILLMTSVGAIYLWLPCMQITGFRAFEALLYSYQLMREVKWKIMLAQIGVLIVVESLVCVCAVYLVSPLAFRIVVALLHAGVTMIYCVRMQIAYFDRDNIDRADIRRYY